MNFTGRTNDNPVLDTREYWVEFDYGEVSELTENVISESMYAAYNDYGNAYLMMESIVDYRKIDKALSVSSQKMVHRGQRFMWRPTVGWKLCVQWRDGLTSWEYIKELEESHPVDTVEYSVSQEIYHEPALNWWVKALSKNISRIISIVKKGKLDTLRRHIRLRLRSLIKLHRHMRRIRITETPYGHMILPRR